MPQATLTLVERWRSKSLVHVVWAIGTALQGQAALLVSGVIAARLLGVEGRGAVALAMILPTIISVVAGAGVPSSTVFHMARAPHYRPHVVTQATHLLKRQIFVGVAAHIVVAYALDRLAGAPFWLGVIALPATAALLIFHQGLAFLQAEQRYGAFNVLRALPATGYAAGLVLLWFRGGSAVTGVVMVWVVAQVMPAMIAMIHFWPPVGPTSEDGPSSRQILIFGVRGMMSSSSPVEVLRLDQAVVGVLLGSAALGLYVTAAAFSNLSRLVTQSIGMVAYPKVASRQASDPAGAMRSLRDYSMLGSGLAALVTIGLYLMLPILIPLLFGDAFSEAIIAAQVLALGALFMGMRRLLAEGAKGLGLPDIGTVGEVLSWVAFLPLVVVLAPRYDIEGAAWATAISGVASCASVLWLVVAYSTTSRVASSSARAG